ncbi:unnamed protein product [Trichobilharzia szidati]|nr:unnamed protein product [Trichobilharzia szidati]
MWSQILLSVLSMYVLWHVCGNWYLLLEVIVIDVTLITWYLVSGFNKSLSRQNLPQLTKKSNNLRNSSKLYEMVEYNNNNEYKQMNELVEKLTKENAYLLHSQTKTLSELNKLRAYIELGRADDEMYARKTDTREASTHKCICETELLEKLKCLENKNSELNHELEQANISIRSLQTVLEIQEKQLFGKSDNKMSNADNNKSEKVEKLLSAWRKHVLRSLIEVENLKIDKLHTVAKSKRDCEKLSIDVESLKASFEANEFKLKASNAALDIERNKRQGLEKDLENLQSELSRAQSDLTKSYGIHREFASNTKEQICQIVKLIQAFMHIPEISVTSSQLQLPTTTTICSAFRRLRQLERRLDFANSRLPLLRTHLLLLHGKSSRLPLKNFTDQSTQINCGLNSWIGDILSESEKDEIISQAQNDMRQAIKERDQALEQLSEYVQSYDQRVHDSEKAVEQELFILQEENRKLNISLQEEQKKLKECLEQLENEKMAHANAKQNYADESTQLKGQLNEVKMKLSQASTALCHAERRIDREINQRKLLMSKKLCANLIN